MNTLKVKEQIENLKGKKVDVKVNIGRNRYEHFEGVILNTYPYLFTISVGTLVKSFGYIDLLTKDIQIKVKNS